MAHSNGLAGSLYWTKWLSTIGILTYLAVYFLEALSLFCIVCSAIQSMVVAFNKDKNTKKPLLKGLSVALTFKLAAEIARTITVRSLDEIIQIGALIMVKAAITALIHWEWKSKDVMTDLDDID